MFAGRWLGNAILFAAFACLLSGCGGSSNAPKVHAVSGVLTVNGQPVPNVILHFVPAKGRPSTGVTDAKGAFELKYEKDVLGVVPGDHKVWIEYRPATPAEEMAMREGKSALAKEVIEALQKYGAPETTPMTLKIDGPKKDLKVEM